MSCLVSVRHFENFGEFPEHTHNEHEIIFIRSGKIVLKNSDGEIYLESPAVISVGNLERHSIASDKAYDRYVIILKPDRFPPDSGQLFSFFLPQFQILDVSDVYSELDMLFGMLDKEFRENGTDNDQDCLIILQTILLLLRRRYPECFPIATQDIVFTVRKVQSRLQHNLDIDITPAQLSNEFNISMYHLIHSFKRITGYSMGQYRLMYRIRVSCDLLVTTNESISSICEKIGFSDMSNYSRYFKKIVGCTPTNYRKNGRNIL